MLGIVQSKEFGILSTSWSKCCLQRRTEAGVVLSNEQNDFLITDAAQMEEIEELSVNICMMAKIQQANTDSDEGPSYDSAFISEVQTPSTSFMNPLFFNSNHEQTYHEQPKIINSPTSDDQINSDIIFDDPYVEVNDESVEHDKNTRDSHDNELDQLARNAYKEERVWVFETTKANKTNFHKEYIEADHRVKRLENDFQILFIKDRDKIRALEKERDDLKLNVSEQRNQVLELKTAHTSLKHKLNAAKDKYLDDVLNLESKLKKKENVVMKMSNSVQALFKLRPKPSSIYYPQLKHGLGYENPYTVKQEISHNPKLYDALYLHSPKVHVNVCDTEEILKDATKSQIKMENKLKDPIAIEKKQIFRPIDYGKLNDLYKNFVPQVELSRKQTYFQKLLRLLELLQTLRATLKHDVQNCVLMCSDSMNDNLNNEIEKVKRESIDVQENLLK
ncbi:hypothetical protein Tco_1375870 [Tanacetum coccineum]